MPIDKQRPILILDDCAVMCNAMRGMLLKMGFTAGQVDLTDSGKEALQLCAAREYQLLLLDFNLGSRRMNGYQVLTLLRQEQRLAADCVVVMLTAEATLEGFRSIMELNPDGYLVKPVSFNLFSRRLHQLLQQQGRLAGLIRRCRQPERGGWLEVGQRLIRTRGIVGQKARLLLAETCIAGGDFNQAASLLNGLKRTGLENRAQLLWAQAELQQQHYATAFALLQPLQEDLLLASSALTLKAEACIRSGQLAEARESLRQAIALAPRNLDRYWLQAFIEMADFELAAAQETLQQAQRFACYVPQDELSLQQLSASLCLDAVVLSSDGTQQAALSRYRQLSRGWQGARHLSQVQRMESLLQLRADLVSGIKPDTETLLALQQQHSDASPQQRGGMVEALEWEKLRLLPDIPDEVLEYNANLKKEWPSHYRQVFDATINVYSKKWKSVMPDDGMHAAVN